MKGRSTMTRPPRGSVRGAPAAAGWVSLAAILAVAGCAAGVSNVSTHSSTTTEEMTTSSAAVTSAGSGEVVSVASPQTVLASWDAALTASSTPPLVITAPLDGQIGSWEGPIGGNNKQALIGGQVRPASDVTAQPRPAEQTITWANGQHRTIPAITAAAAVAALVADGSNSSCGGCDPVTALTLHDPQLMHQPISTAAAPATIPVWSFAVNGQQSTCHSRSNPPVLGPPPGPARPDRSTLGRRPHIHCASVDRRFCDDLVRRGGGRCWALWRELLGSPARKRTSRRRHDRPAGNPTNPAHTRHSIDGQPSHRLR